MTTGVTTCSPQQNLYQSFTSPQPTRGSRRGRLAAAVGASLHRPPRNGPHAPGAVVVVTGSIPDRREIDPRGPVHMDNTAT
jgi:hypothetical protein